MSSKDRPSPAGALDIAPWDGMLLEVRRASYKVNWIDWMLVKLHETEKRLEQEVEEETDADMRKVKRNDLSETRLELKDWTKESRAERGHLVVVCDKAVRAGLNQRILSQIQLEQETITRVMIAGLAVLNLGPIDQAQVLNAMLEATREIAFERRGDGPLARELEAHGRTSTGPVGVGEVYPGVDIYQAFPVDGTHEDTRFED